MRSPLPLDPPPRPRGRWVPAAAVATVTIAAIVAAITMFRPEGGCRVEKAGSPAVRSFDAAPAPGLQPDRLYSAFLETSRGRIDVAFDASAAPVSVNNFVFLASKGFYDDTTFHRVVRGGDGAFIVGGDPTDSGTGGAGYTFASDPMPFAAGLEAKRIYKRGQMVMANRGSLETASSQFFIVAADYVTDQPFTVFGTVDDAQSLRVVDQIAGSAGAPWLDGAGIRPLPAVALERVLIQECEATPE